jgi:hypothetical protein
MKVVRSYGECDEDDKGVLESYYALFLKKERILKINNSALIITKINGLFCGCLKINYLTCNVL